MLQDSGSITSINSATYTKRDIFHRAGRYLWGPDPINCLCHSYFITPKNHTILRFIFGAYHILILIWTFIWLPKPWDLLAYLTLWGFSICTIYFSLVNFVKLSHHSKKRWKAVYVLGEIGATLEFLICPFFFAFLFPAFLKNNTAWDQILLQICLHLFCPIFIWIETIMNAIAFPKRHLWLLLVIIIVYPINNFLWTKYFWGHPVYPVMTWEGYQTWVYIIIACIMGFGGFFVGRVQYRRKKTRPFLRSRTPTEEVMARLRGAEAAGEEEV